MEKATILLLLLVFNIYTATAAPSKPQPCPQPSSEELQELFRNNFYDATIFRSHFTCLAVRQRNLYQSASVLMQYNTTEGNVMIKHFEIECDSESWTMSGTSLDTTNTSLFDLETRYDCYRCIQPTQTKGRKGSPTKGKKGPHHHRRMMSNIMVDEETHCRGETKLCFITLLCVVTITQYNSQISKHFVIMHSHTELIHIVLIVDRMQRSLPWMGRRTL